MFYVVPSIKKLLNVLYIFFTSTPLTVQTVTNGRSTQLQENLENCQEIILLWSHENVLFQV